MKKISLIICYCVALLLAGSPAVAGISASLTNTQLRATPVPVSVSGTAAVSGPLTDTQLRATPVPVSGTVTVSGTAAVSGPLTDAQLRATDLPIKSMPQTSGGLSVYHMISTASGNENIVKNSPGQVFGWSIGNVDSNPISVVFHNLATTPVQTTTPALMSVLVPAGQSVNVFDMHGIAFSAGISMSISSVTTTISDGLPADVGANKAKVDVFYK